MVRSHLDYCSSVWLSYRKGDRKPGGYSLEKVRKKATKLIPELKCMNYIDRLKMSAAYTTLPKNTRRHD